MTKEFSVFITNDIPDVQLMANGQCFPLCTMMKKSAESPTLFDAPGRGLYPKRWHFGFHSEACREEYGNNVGKEDIFYYVYGALHSPDYRTAFCDSKKMLPRIPLIDDVRDFWRFSRAGRNG